MLIDTRMNQTKKDQLRYLRTSFDWIETSTFSTKTFFLFCGRALKLMCSHFPRIMLMIRTDSLIYDVICLQFCSFFEYWSLGRTIK